MEEPNEDRLDEVLRQLDEAPESVSKAFGKTTPTPTFTERKSTPYRRPERRETHTGEKVEPSRIKPMPNVYLVRDGEPVEWVGFFKDEETANMWVNDRKETFVVEFGDKRDLPMWGREERKRKHGRKA